jgi:hypothetical protein
MSNDRRFVRVDPSGECKEVAKGSYEAIVEAIGTPIDFTVLSPNMGAFVQDEGILNRERLNIPVSLLATRAIYGPVVLTDARPDEEGDSLPPPMDEAMFVVRVATAWNKVVVACLAGGTGDPYTYGNPDTLAGPIILTDEEVDQFFKLGGDG